VYGARYISDRYLPDKAIDLVDEAASALRLAQESKPDELEALDRDVVRMEIELESLKAETDVFSFERRGKIEKDLKERKEKAEELTAIWQNGTPHAPQGVSSQAKWGRLRRASAPRPHQRCQATP
jgi:ATP-dependent Clp protease ATP-binding subunit ClpB